VSTTGNQNVLCAVPTNDATAFTSMSLGMETTRARVIVSSPGTTTKLSGKINLAALTGVTFAKYISDDRYSATLTSSPAEVLVLHVLTSTMLKAITQQTYFTIQLYYEAELFDPFQLTQS